jgi:hypothetical protein
MASSLGPARIGEANFTCRERADRGPLAVLRAAADLVIVAGPATTTAEGWHGSGDCALARRWAKEIANQR